VFGFYMESSSFLSSKEFVAIVGGVAGFWGCVLAMGSVYISMVIIRRCLSKSCKKNDPEES